MVRHILSIVIHLTQPLSYSLAIESLVTVIGHDYSLFENNDKFLLLLQSNVSKTIIFSC